MSELPALEQLMPKSDTTRVVSIAKGPALESSTFAGLRSK